MYSHIEYDRISVLVVRIKSFQPVFQRLRSRYRTINFGFVKRRRLGALGVKISRLGIFCLVSFLMMLLFANTTLGEAELSDYRRVLLKRDASVEAIVTNQATVGGLLDDLDIELGHMEFVRPLRSVEIEGHNFLVEILEGYEIEIIDGDQRELVIVSGDDPAAIIASLGYVLGEADTVGWLQEPNSNQAGPALIEIKRAHTYQLNINGELETVQAQATEVNEILEELDHTTDEIAYIIPALDQTLEPEATLIVYYERPYHEIIIEIEVIRDQTMVTEHEVVYEMVYNPQTHQILEYNLIQSSIISQLPISESAFRGTVGRHTVGQPNALQESWLTQAGVDQSDWFYVDYIIFAESHWNYAVWNMHGSGAYGLCQALPAVKMQTFGADYLTNPVTQLRWCDWYAQDRYGSWRNAYDFWRQNYWW